MNRVILVGRLTRDPEVRYTNSGIAVATFTLAVDRRFARRDAQDGQPTADFIPIVCWRKLAEVCGNNLVKGRRVGIEGRMQVRSYDAQDGSKRYVTEVIADEVEFLDSKNASHEGGFAPAPAPEPASQAQQPAQGQGFGPSISEEDIPF